MQKPNKPASKRSATVERRTKETAIFCAVDLDGTGAYDIATGVGFLDHMIEHSGIVLGQAFAKALGDKQGIARYGSAYLPMDETLTRVALDVSGRPVLVWKVDFTGSKIGEMDTV